MRASEDRVAEVLAAWHEAKERGEAREPDDVIASHPQIADDLRGVPDGGDARDSALRAGLGNLKRCAEELFEKNGCRARSVDNAVPRFPLRGVKRSGAR